MDATAHSNNVRPAIDAISSVAITLTMNRRALNRMWIRMCPAVALAAYLKPRDRDLNEPENNSMQTSAVNVGSALDNAITSLSMARAPIEIVNTKSTARLAIQDAAIITMATVLE